MQNLVQKLLPRTTFKQAVAFRAYCTNKILDIGQPTASSHPQLLNEGEITPGITAEEYITRRKRLLELLPQNGLAIIAAAPVKMMTDVVPYTFRQDADYLYITGCLQPGGLAVMSHEFGLCMFMPETKPYEYINKEIMNKYDGKRWARKIKDYQTKLGFLLYIKQTRHMEGKNETLECIYKACD